MINSIISRIAISVDNYLDFLWAKMVPQVEEIGSVGTTDPNTLGLACNMWIIYQVQNANR